MIRSPLFQSIPGIDHGFGTRGSELPAGVVTAKQVHGVEILKIPPYPPLSKGGGGDFIEPQGFDILLTGEKGIAVAVKTADCLPILMAEPRLGVVAAVHAGWRGTVARVAEKAVERLLALGGRIENLVVALGPNMTASCYEVEGEIAASFEKEFPGWPVLTRKSDKKWLLDIAGVNFRQLGELGISPDRIDRIDLCTHCRADLFHSHRRDGAEAGRMVNFIRLTELHHLSRPIGSFEDKDCPSENYQNSFIFVVAVQPDGAGRTGTGRSGHM